MRHELDGAAKVCPYPHSDKTVTTIKAIETVAYGRRFRSRTEAKWAVFFTTLGVSWEYEPEGFEIEGTRYLPDFRVWTPQGQPIWYEIKGRNVVSEAKFELFCRSTDERAYMLSGEPIDALKTHEACPRCGSIQLFEEWDYDDEQAFNCFACDMETPGGGGHPLEHGGFLGCSFRPHKGLILTPKSNLVRLNRELKRAASAAASARFEHGETP